jgi:hypothetical protein
VAIWVAIVISLTVLRLVSKQSRKWFRELALIALGGLAFSALIILFFSLQAALPHFWSAAFEYNFVYSARADSLMSERLDAIVKGVRPLSRAGLLQIALIGYMIAIGLILFRRTALEKVLDLALIGLLALPLELILIDLPGRTFAHYYMTLLPTLALFTGLAVWGLTSPLPDEKMFNTAKYVLALILVGFIAWRSFDDYLNQLYIYRDLTNSEPVIEYVERNTSPDDLVLLWGSDASINYFSERSSPTRFVYQSPLQQEGYVDEAMIDEFLDDVIQNQPRLVIDTGTRDPLFSFPLTSDSIEEKSSYLLSRYCIVEQIDDWKIHEYRQDGCNS